MFRSILIGMIVRSRRRSNIITIESPFLTSNLNESIFMEIPSGMNAKYDEYRVLKKTIYGLVHSACQFMRQSNPTSIKKIRNSHDGIRILLI